MRQISTLTILLICAINALANNWPKELKTDKGGVITIYQPQPEKLEGNKLTGRAAFSARAIPGDPLVFGVFWFTSAFVTDRDSREVMLEKILINEIRLPGVEDPAVISRLKTFLEEQIPKWEIRGSLDDITATIEQEQTSVRHDFKNEAPQILFTTTPTMLVIIDGEPKVQGDPQLKANRVVNSAFLIVENPSDKRFYLFGGKFWYSASSATGPFKPAAEIPKSIAGLAKQVEKPATDPDAPVDSIPPIITVSIKPAELIQSNGEPQYASIEGTTLLYMSNSRDNVFKYIPDQNFYVLLSGRWYTAPETKGPWKYLPAESLPPDFAKIPEGSPKDNVLASVPGTEASRNAIMDAQIPQTARVERSKAKTMVTYDGAPKFEVIEGTSLQLAMNTKSTVLKEGSIYYCVESGVWFVADQPTGPWKVSDKRPADVEKIPPSSPAYNTQYVYIYDSTPEVVYVGYTPGYMGCYAYGGTVVYGTGYYYYPWYGPYYYPHPMTYGYSMHYNPWCGWSMGFHYSTGWMSFSFYGGGYGGYWGPPMYRPPYYPPHRPGGIYGDRGPSVDHHNNINRDRSNNMYNRQPGISTNDVRRDGARPTQLPADRRDGTRGDYPRSSQLPADRSGQPRVNQPTAGPRNDVFSDRNGNVYQRNENGNWNQCNGNQWQQTDRQSGMDRDFQNRQRSATQNNSFQQMNRGGNMGGGARMGGGGRRR